MNPKLVIKKINKYGKANFPKVGSGGKVYEKKTGEGFGVFADDDLKKGTTLFVMGGYILTIEDENDLSGIVADKPIEISEDFSIGPRSSSDLPKMPQHYVNHSCDPNAGFKGQIFMVAMKNIKKGAEIVYDYAMVMHTNERSDSFFTFDCVCGSKKCRHVVGENDWKIMSLQEQYDGYFQYFIQEKIYKKRKANL
jgi:hypothetical protein